MRPFQQIEDERVSKEKALFLTILLGGLLWYFFGKIIVWTKEQRELKMEKPKGISIVEVSKPLPAAGKILPIKVKTKSVKLVKSDTKWHRKPSKKGTHAMPSGKQKKGHWQAESPLITSHKSSPFKEYTSSSPQQSSTKKDFGEKQSLPIDAGNSFRNAHASEGLNVDGWAFRDNLHLENISPEEGFVKFEIVLNEKGEIQAIKTIGNSLMPATITMYKNYLRSRATFVRTAGGYAPATSRGTLTINVKFY